MDNNESECGGGGGVSFEGKGEIEEGGTWTVEKGEEGKGEEGKGEEGKGEEGKNIDHFELILFLKPSAKCLIGFGA